MARQSLSPLPPETQQQSERHCIFAAHHSSIAHSVGRSVSHSTKFFSPFTKCACLCCLAGKFKLGVRVGAACDRKAHKSEMDSHYVTKPSRKTHTHTHTHTIFENVCEVVCLNALTLRWMRAAIANPSLFLKTKNREAPRVSHLVSCLKQWVFFYQLVEILPQCLSLMEPFSAQAEKLNTKLFTSCGICLPSV